MEEKLNLILVYDLQTKRIECSKNFGIYFEPKNAESSIEDFFPASEFDSSEDMKLFYELFNRTAASAEIAAEGCRIKLRKKNNEFSYFGLVFATVEPGKKVVVSFRDLTKEIRYINHLDHLSKYDELTGLMNATCFRRFINEIFMKRESSDLAGKYAIIYFDVIRFKAVNEMYGKSNGDMLLMHIAEVIKKNIAGGEADCRINSDRFALFVRSENRDLADFVTKLLDNISEYELSVTINCNVGIYQITETGITVTEMLDRAILAQSSIKGIFTQQYKFYTDELRKQMLSEQEVVGNMVDAMKKREFVPFFQPQYNHSTGTLVGAEALVRWIHPEKGLISPSVFIPIFENNGFITPLDMYIFERACEFIKKCLDEGLNAVPISTNFSRYDIFQQDFVEQLETSRKKYDVPVNLLRIEITESAVFGGSEMTNQVVRKLHNCGYIVEMDDFGSGYSSLNVLKDVEFDIIKLDMKFLSDNNSNGRGGTVISSIVNMAKWLNLPVIAEGVETLAQADFLRSIGTEFIQGYLYSKPLPENNFIELLRNPTIKKNELAYKKSETFNIRDFWDPTSLDTLIFSNFAGGACILKYDKANNGKFEILRINRKYLKELGMNFTEKDIIEQDIEKKTDIKEVKIYREMLDRAILSGEEDECETLRTFNKGTSREETLRIRSTVRLIGRKGDLYLFYVMIRNVTNECRPN